MTIPPHLPIDDALSRIEDLLDPHRVLVLSAPPGTGKTTRVPPALLGAPWLRDNRIVLLEPRRVAARAAAARIAEELGQEVGGLVGLRTRFETRVSRDTKLEIVTEGVLTRMLLSDPSLDGVGLLIFDEFHERSIHADTGLAFARETASALREDLRIVVMSATIDASVLASRFDSAAVVEVSAPSFPVETRYVSPEPGRRPADAVADAVIEVLEGSSGDILVFLAGAGDIRRVGRSLDGRLPPDVVTTPLHGSLPPAAQDRALRIDPNGRRKVILSTPLAETSVTVDGVTTVIDDGRRRRPELDIGRGMSRLRTVTASKAATDQRRGRAGRQGPGLCVRLWAEADQVLRPPDERPEILTADLTPLALHIAAWGVSDANELPWLDPPPAAGLAAGRRVLESLGALDDAHRLTAHGRTLAELGTEPRLAHMLVRGAELGAAATACDLAAVLADRDLLTGRDRPVDLRLRIDALHRAGPGVDPARRGRARELAARWRRHFDAVGQPVDPDLIGPLTTLAFPDRIAQRRADAGMFLLASGAGVSMSKSDSLAREGLLAVAETNGVGAEAQIVTAAPVDRDDLEMLHADRIVRHSRGEWDRRARDVVFERQERLGALVLRREPDANPERNALNEALMAGVRREGLRLLGWSAAADRWRERLEFLHRHNPQNWPAFDDQTLLDTLEEWLRPSMGNARRRDDLGKVDVKAALNNRLDWRQSRDVDRLAPSHIEVPSGSRIPIDYGSQSGPVLAVRLQEMFGLADTPTIVDGSVPVVLHLLSPAHRPVQVTTDLASFWEQGYPEVRRELRGRYPKHHWPEDPAAATPTGRIRRRG